VVGWHYATDVLARLARQPDLDVFVLSHRPIHAVPRYVFDSVPIERVLVRPNVGYDWGAYQQFLEVGTYARYSVVFLMHDDVAIHDDGWMQASIELLERGHQVVGNARNGSETRWPNNTPWCYAPSDWKPPSRAYRHETVRGSFIATTSATLARAQRFEVFWDWLHLTEGFGNWSMRATCGKLQWLFGERCFGFLSESYRTSAYMTEMERGGVARAIGTDADGRPGRRLRQPTNTTWLKLRLVDYYRAVCTRYMQAYEVGDAVTCRRLRPMVMLPARRGWRRHAA
jgi:hypothetical protein